MGGTPRLRARLAAALLAALFAVATSSAVDPAPADSGVVMDDLRGYAVNLLRLQALAFQQHLSDRIAHYYDPLHAPQAADSLPADAAAKLSQGVVSALLLQTMGQQMQGQPAAAQPGQLASSMLGLLAAGGGGAAVGGNPLAALASGANPFAAFASSYGRRRLAQAQEGAPPAAPTYADWEDDEGDDEGSILYEDDYDEASYFGYEESAEWGWLSEDQAAAQGQELQGPGAGGVEVLALGVQSQDVVSLLAGMLDMTPADAAALIGADPAGKPAPRGGALPSDAALPHFAVFGPGAVAEGEAGGASQRGAGTAAATSAAQQQPRFVELVVAPFTSAARSPVPHQAGRQGGMDVRWWGAIVGAAVLGLVSVAVAASRWTSPARPRTEDPFGGHLVPYHNMPGAPPRSSTAAWEQAVREKEALQAGAKGAPRAKAGHLDVPRKTSNLPA